ncbi:uncharacterized protein LOC143246890 [Tachypleus tridentatus]|uniref:uncharacterized protein LOC143246890 n=1 Tax=Tachypleus tridentatus TaxID=6853 RepID=UPI003FD131CC
MDRCQYYWERAYVDAEPLDGFSMTQSPSNEAIDHTAKLETLSLSSRQQISSDTSASVLEKQVGVEVLETSPTEDIGSAKSDESFLKVETTNLSWSEDSSATDDSISDCVNMELISNSNPNVNEFSTSHHLLP